MIFVLIVVFTALVFELINGFHDAANSIATVVSTKVLTPTQGVIIAGTFELIGALCGTAVATTIGTGLVDLQFITQTTIFCGLLGGIVWNLLTWWLGLPSSSSHALMGGLCGAGVASAHNNLAVIQFATLKSKVLIPMVLSPVVGFTVAFGVMVLLLWLLRNWTPRTVNLIFGKAQIFSAAFMGFSHGTNDAQKTMGIIALTLFTATQTEVFQSAPGWMDFLRTPAARYHAEDITKQPADLQALVSRLNAHADPLSAMVYGRLSEASRTQLKTYPGGADQAPELRAALATDLNHLAQGPMLYETNLFAGVKLSEQSRLLLKQKLNPDSQFRLNAWLIKDIFPKELKRREFDIALWIKVLCAITIASGTALGGWRIIRTLGKDMVKLLPIHGFAAQTTAAGIIATASFYGAPISTTHVITTSIMGVGTTKRLTAVKWKVVGNIVVAWVLTLPISAGLAYGITRLVLAMQGGH
jgi:phosphate/sulfate permease